jgi:molybdopterin biosynthesis enzyme
MALTLDTSQTIARLTPLVDVLAMADQRVKAVAPRTVDATTAEGRVLASDALVPGRPNSAIALLDGWAVNAYETLGAGGYTPALLPRPPQRIEAGQPMPPDTDSVAAFDTIRIARDRTEVLATINPGDGVLPAGGDCDPAIPLRRAGDRLRVIDVAVFAAAGLARVRVREPRIHILPVRGSAIVAATARLVADDIERRGGTVRLETGRDLGLAFAAENSDMTVVIGGTGSGRNDTSVHTLAREGELAVHGVAITPGETAALGFIGTRPALLLPGRLDAALAVWLTVGHRLLARLAAGGDADPAMTSTLARKVASSVGLAEFVPVRRNDDTVEPLAKKYLPLSALTRADGWILVPAGSEGYPEGTAVTVHPWL